MNPRRDRSQRNGSQQDGSQREQLLSAHKVRDRALILPLVGLVILTPPVAGIFQLDLRIAGIPFTVLYLFAVWGLLIAGAAVLSQQLRDDERPDREAGPSAEVRE